METLRQIREQREAKPPPPKEKSPSKSLSLDRVDAKLARWEQDIKSRLEATERVEAKVARMSTRLDKWSADLEQLKASASAGTQRVASVQESVAQLERALAAAEADRSRQMAQIVEENREIGVLLKRLEVEFQAKLTNELDVVRRNQSLLESRRSKAREKDAEIAKLSSQVASLEAKLDQSLRRQKKVALHNRLAALEARLPPARSVDCRGRCTACHRRKRSHCTPHCH